MRTWNNTRLLKENNFVKNFSEMKRILITLLCMAALSSCCRMKTDRIGIIVSGFTDPSETEALKQILAEYGSKVTVLPYDKIPTADIEELATIIYHRSDTSAIQTYETGLMKQLTPFISKGGNLILSMDAVRLLNTSGIEPQQITVRYEDAVDHGFGRPLGFHGYRSHPIYEGLLGGAYVWKATYDHKARTLGFSDNHVPKADGAKVLGINWAYIRYNEDRKILWETPVGEGRILAIGGHMYFSQKNLNRSTLLIFMHNVIDWLNGSRRFESPARSWAYDTIAVAKSTYPGRRIRIKTETAWEPAESQLTGRRKCSPEHYWNVSGQQIVAFGRETGKVEEIWIHPIMALRDLSVGVRIHGSDDIIWMDTAETELIRCPEYLERRHTLSDGCIREIYNASVTEPLLSINYRWDSPSVEAVVIRYKSNLRLMWPYSLDATGTLFYATQQNGAVTAIFDRSQELNAMTVFDTEPTHVETITENKDKSISFTYCFPADKGRLNMYISGGESGIRNTAGLIQSYMGKTQRIYEESKVYYSDFNKDFLTIESSDSLFNLAYRWNQISLDKFFCHTPSLGKSLMAGFWSSSRGWNGGHKVSGRPGYTWYFGRDTEFSGLALTDYGDYEKVRHILTTFGKFQDPDGKVYHELTTSGSAHYDAADATPLYLVLAGYYMRRSGDVEFIRTQWEHILKALSFCKSTDTDGDGLIENTNVGHGWQECWELHGAHTEVYLAAIWTQALKECAYMAEQMGDTTLAGECKEAAARCMEHLDNGFWNEELAFYNHGLMQDGSWQEEKCVLGGTPVFFGLADKNKAVKTASNFSNRYFSTDWGVRMVGYDSPHFGLGGYRYGNIWPFHNGCAATAEYRAGLRYQGFRHAYSDLRLFDKWDYGNLPEVILGDAMKFTGICPHQQWSSSMNLYPLYVGMLGLEADAVKDSISLAPAFPADWTYADVRNIRCGEKKADLSYIRTAQEYRYSISCEQKMNMTFTAVLPLGTKILYVKKDGADIPFQTEADIQNVCVSIEPFALEGSKDIVIGYSGGIGILLNMPAAEINMPDEGLRIERESFEDGVYTLDVAGVPGRSYDIDILAFCDIRNITGAEEVTRKGNTITLRTVFPESSSERFTGMSIRICTDLAF